MTTTNGTFTYRGLPGSTPSVPDLSEPVVDDPLDALESIVGEYVQKNHELANRKLHRAEHKDDFIVDFWAVCEREVRPAMLAVLGRLEAVGGGGLLEEHPGGEARSPDPRLRLWMSLAGHMVLPRVHCHPYLQVAADLSGRRVRVSEGDLWCGDEGWRIGRGRLCALGDLSRSAIIDELLDVARRAS